MRGQKGLSFFGFIIVAIVVALVAITGFKLVPAYVEYFGVKKALTAVVKEHASSNRAAILEAFSKQATIGYITSVTPQDIVIVQAGGKTTLSASYEKVIPLVGNVSLLLDFNAEASSGSAAE
jgi:Tfp pilus assembly major pilin PilA